MDEFEFIQDDFFEIEISAEQIVLLPENVTVKDLIRSKYGETLISAGQSLGLKKRIILYWEFTMIYKDDGSIKLVLLVRHMPHMPSHLAAASSNYNLVRKK